MQFFFRYGIVRPYTALGAVNYDRYDAVESKILFIHDKISCIVKLVENLPILTDGQTLEKINNKNLMLKKTKNPIQ